MTTAPAFDPVHHERHDDELPPADALAVLDDRLDDVTTEVWSLVDAVADLRHASAGHGDRVQLHIAQDRLSQAWSHLQVARRVVAETRAVTS